MVMQATSIWVYILAFFVPSSFSIVLNTVIVICCLQQCRCDGYYAKLDDDEDDSDSEISTQQSPLQVFPLLTTTTSTVASPSELPDDAPPPYSATTAPQAGYYGKLSHSLATAYPQMLQPTTCTPTILKYSATDNKLFYYTPNILVLA